MHRRSSGSSEDSHDASHNTGRRHEPLKPTGATTRSSQPAASNQVLPGRSRDSSARSSSARTRRFSATGNWHLSHTRNGSAGKVSALAMTSSADDDSSEEEKAADRTSRTQRLWSRNSWAISILTFAAAFIGIALLYTVLYSSNQLHCDVKGCRMSYMRPSYTKLDDFDTEHTRFASKYSLYLYREAGIDIDNKVTGVPVLFIPGNAGSYKQVRPIASEAATYFHDVLQHDTSAGAQKLDFFTVDFNEDFTAFHGQTILDQAEYLNEAIRYVLSLYLDPKASRRNTELPDPTSVIILGHSMGGIVARTMLIMPNYQANSINTIITMSAPHARPPITFDSQIVQIYDEMNGHWRQSYAEKLSNNNPLRDVTLVSIAGGGLDTVVPSDYAGLESIVPETHGFTVFTSTIPNVWTSMDHLAILWCDQFRKVVVRALYDVIDAHRPSQTTPRVERMKAFKKWFLTGMEDTVEKASLQNEPSTLLKFDDESGVILAEGERLTIPHLGSKGKPVAYLMPLQPSTSLGRKKFTLLSDTSLDMSAEGSKLEVLFCSVFPQQPGQTITLFSSTLDLSDDAAVSTKLACKNAAPDMINLPPSTSVTENPFFREHERQLPPFSYLEHSLEDLVEYHFVAIVDKGLPPANGWVVAEISDSPGSRVVHPLGLHQLLSIGLHFELPRGRPLVTDVKIPSIQSSLLAFNLQIEETGCENQRFFTPLVRQYLAKPYESKFFVNAHNVEISLHGISPYMPPPMTPKSHGEEGLSLQFWLDTSCDSTVSVHLTVNPLASLGKLYMRYRTIFAAFPLLIVTLVLRKQFRAYDETGVFISFSESLDACLRRSLPALLLSLTFLSVSASGLSSSWPVGNWPWGNYTSSIEFAQNDLLTGTAESVFWFLIPLIGVICIGVCIVTHYAILVLTYLFSVAYGMVSLRLTRTSAEENNAGGRVAFRPSSPQRRLATTLILLLLVSTFIPYQFAYVVACVVQLSTSARASWLGRQRPSLLNVNFSNYTHSVFILMFWVLPINLPTLVVWIRNLAIQWFTPFSSHHNVMSIIPFILLVELLTTGEMIPRMTSRLRHLTSLLFFTIAVYAAVYGVSHAYMLHRLVNVLVAWLVAIHFASRPWSIAGLGSVLDSNDSGTRKQGKAP